MHIYSRNGIFKGKEIFPTNHSQEFWKNEYIKSYEINYQTIFSQRAK